METHPSILAWEIPWTEESGRLQSMGSQKSQTGLRDYTTATTPGWGSSLWVFNNAFPWVLGEPLNQGFHFSVLKKFLNSFSHIFFPFTFSLSFFHWNSSWSNHLDFFLTWIVYSFYFCFSQLSSSAFLLANQLKLHFYSNISSFYDYSLNCSCLQLPVLILYMIICKIFLFSLCPALPLFPSSLNFPICIDHCFSQLRLSSALKHNNLEDGQIQGAT